MKEYKGNKEHVDLPGNRIERYWRLKSGQKSDRTRAEHERGAVAAIDWQNKLVSKYNFGAVEYGNWMSNNDRYIRCVDLVDGLGELKLVVKTDNFGMDRLLNISFGGRGQGGRVNAHFEPWDNTINLTKTHYGNFVHEWTHAVDYIIGRNVDISRKGILSNGGESLLRQYAADIISKRYKYPLPTQNAGCYARPTEILARTMEDFVAHKLNANKANILVKNKRFYEDRDVVYMTDAARMEIFPVCEKFCIVLGWLLSGKEPKQVPAEKPKAAAAKVPERKPAKAPAKSDKIVFKTKEELMDVFKSIEGRRKSDIAYFKMFADSGDIVDTNAQVIAWISGCEYSKVKSGIINRGDATNYLVPKGWRKVVAGCRPYKDMDLQALKKMASGAKKVVLDGSKFDADYILRAVRFLSLSKGKIVSISLKYEDKLTPIRMDCGKYHVMVAGLRD